MHSFLYFVAGLYALQFVLGPILVRMSQKLLAEPQFEPVDPESMPQEVRDFFTQKSSEFLSEGFSIRTYLFIKDFVPNQLMHIMMVENASNKDTGIAVAAEMKAAKFSKISEKYVEFYTEFSDGSNLTVNNSSHPNIFKATPERTVIQLPEVRDAATLYKTYQRAINRFGKWGKVSMIGRDPADILRSSIEKEMATQMKTGYFYLDRDGGAYRPTWKGAVLMTWKMIWPIKSILLARRKGSNRQLLEGLQIR